MFIHRRGTVNFCSERSIGTRQCQRKPVFFSADPIIYGVLLHDPASGATASIDAPEAAPIEAALKATGWKIDRHPGHASPCRPH